jgi:PIN domain nuclease of toxin-antitoxin system
MNEPGATVLLSAVVVWEIAIKRALAKLEAPQDFVHLWIDSGALPLPVSLAHAALVESLPTHHRDPFDRLLISQAITENAVLVTADATLARYDVPILW